MQTYLRIAHSLKKINRLIFGQHPDKQAIRNLYGRYQAALLSDRGAEATDCVDSRTIAYYDDMLEVIKSGDRNTVDSLPMLDKMLVLIIRHRVGWEEILTFDGRSLFAYAVDKGMTGKNRAGNTRLGRIKIVGDFARARIFARGLPTPWFYHFYREEGKWKMDLTSLFPLSVHAFESMIEKSGQSENEFIFFILFLMTGRKPGEEIWDPLVV